MAITLTVTDVDLGTTLIYAFGTVAFSGTYTNGTRRHGQLAEHQRATRLQRTTGCREHGQSGVRADAGVFLRARRDAESVQPVAGNHR